MTRALSETPAVNGTDSEAQRRTFWPLTLGCMGVVYGDIGTSPLYAFRVALDAAGGSQGDLSRATVIGVLSLILWALFLVVTAKYVLILLRADNKGEGGTLSLMALAQRALKSARAQSVVVVLGMIAAALFYGDALLTPAISVLSAVEGLEVAAPQLQSYVVPVTVLASSLLAGLEHVRLPLAATAAAGVVDLGLAALLVPHHGAVGAAIANAAAQVAAGVPLILYSARRAGPIRWEWGALLRCAAVSAAGGAAAWGVATALGGLAGLVLGLLAGTAVFFPLAAVVGLLSREDAAWASDVLGARAGELPRRLVLALARRERG